ncbi:DUF4932 domain-containing protein [Dyadobacter sp. Leaf189]|uniref:DUF4932 domain-containing protein n=1 Tax=Dyadobacter sp. Leaf189 TaxID=1736295 RepID=UPI000700835E|nr:DUF4932 domain-containing protein [Dyadobacter sp. Leaf189]KQS26871.1 hypothetical protein ASG33_20215 [Dyadobacter sp. Leaf189]
MYRQLLFLLTLSWAPFAAARNTQIQVKINKNAELLGFVYFLGYEGAHARTSSDYPEKRRIRYAYGLDLYRQYQAHEKSPHLAVAIGFAQDIWLDYFINLLVQLDDFPNAKLNEDIDFKYYKRFSAKGDKEEASKNAAAFIEAMNQLYKEVDFDSYLTKNRLKYDNVLAQVRSGLPDSLFVPAMEKFYQGHFDSYNLVPSLTIPAGMGFGVSYISEGKSHAFNVFGSFAAPRFEDDQQLNMGFDDEKHLEELSTHEFAHSFVNPIIDKLPRELITAAEKLFVPVKSSMADQGYTTWKACLYEHFVRAGEVVIAKNLGKKDDAERLMQHYVQDRKFIYLPVILRELEAYNAKQEGSYPDAVRLAMERLVEEARR